MIAESVRLGNPAQKHVRYPALADTIARSIIAVMKPHGGIGAALIWLQAHPLPTSENSPPDLQIRTQIANMKVIAQADEEYIRSYTSVGRGAKLRVLRAAPEGELRVFLNRLNTHDHLQRRLFSL
jgi:hypothetical protein